MTTPPDGSGLPAPWGARTLPDDQTLAIRLGGRDLWIRWSDGEIQVATEERKEHAGDLATWGYGEPPPSPAESAEWSRWATPSGERRIGLHPVLPDRPVVLEPEWPFRLLPGAEAKVLVRVPLWIRIELVREEGSLKVQEIPAVTLSDTWWGELDQGELAFWLPTTARRAMAPRLFAPHVAVCPLLVRNEADSELGVEKLALRVAHLSLFHLEGRIWADESRVRYQGGEEGSRIEMTGRPPEEAAGAALVSGPRTPVEKGFRARTFGWLRSLPGLGASL